jgi:hypothetical protein
MELSGMFTKTINPFICIVLLVSGCSSQMGNVSDDFKVSLEKWTALSRFSESFLEETPFKVLVSITRNNNINQGLKFNGFRLSRHESPFEINLLAPNITSKYICNPNCVYLSELVILNNSKLDVVSNIYFEANEFELFEFYSKLYQLNSKVEKYTRVNDPLFIRYLDWLSSSNPAIDKLSDFVSYLEQALNEESFIDFVNNPKKRFIAMDNALSENKSWTNLDPLENKSWTNLDPLENKSWTNIDLLSSVNWSDETIPWDSPSPVPEIKIASQQSQQDEHPMGIDDVVCIGTLNQFGLVTQVIGHEIKVAIQGELRVFTDGLLSNAKPNRIIDLSGKVNFVRINKTNTFPLNELTQCDVY